MKPFCTFRVLDRQALEEKMAIERGYRKSRRNMTGLGVTEWEGAGGSATA